MGSTLNPDGFIHHSGNIRELLFYKKSVILYDLTYHFCSRFLTGSKDRTVDQMIQAARSGKQNIVEGLSDGSTSTEMAIKLLNVARGSLAELQEDFQDYLRTRGLKQWKKEHPRYEKMQEYCYQHHELEDYQVFFDRWDEETLSNTALTLIHQADKGMTTYLAKMERDFLNHGGIREAMTVARKKSKRY